MDSGQPVHHPLDTEVSVAFSPYLFVIRSCMGSLGFQIYCYKLGLPSVPKRALLPCGAYSTKNTWEKESVPGKRTLSDCSGRSIFCATFLEGNLDMSFMNLFFVALGFELSASHLLGRPSYCLSHSASPVLCWVLSR
jgi:hypothetical protein